MSQIVAAARVSVFVAGCVVAGIAWQASAQTAQVSLKDFEASMIEIGEAFEIIGEMTPSPAYLLNSVRGDSLARLDTALERMNAVRTFFADRNTPDAVGLSDDTIAAMKAFREELTRATPDQAAAAEALDAVVRACTACHEVYREGDEDQGYRLKAGVL